jgi:enterochelin esterase-like enzyme
VSTIYAYPDEDLGYTERHTRWEPEGGTGVYRRSLYVWKNFTARYKTCDLVLFLDGQNLFAATRNSERAPTWHAEKRLSQWERPLIVVGIPASKRRYPEYIGWSNEPGHYSSSGDRHAAFLVNYVVPYIKSLYPRARLKGLVGASAGGVAALYTGWLYPRAFPSIGCLSAGRHYFYELLQRFEGRPARRVYLSCGNRGMDRGFVLQNQGFATALKARGTDVRARWHHGGHSERVWGRRIPDLLDFLL